MTQTSVRNNILISIAFVFAMAFTGQAMAQAKRKSAPAPTQDKVDISDLENKYWAPKDTDFSVVQNRTYSKDKRFLITPQWGRPINDPYSEGNLFGITLNYFWSERMGVQAVLVEGDLDDNQASKDIQNLGSGAVPNHSKFKRYVGFGYNFVPFYAKMSFWNKRIIYFDMAFTPHVGVTWHNEMRYDAGRGSYRGPTQTAPTVGIDITQFFFFNRWFAIRADLKNQWHYEDVKDARAPYGVVKPDKLIHDTQFLVGTTFYF